MMKKASDEKIIAIWEALHTFAKSLEEKHGVVITVGARSFSAGNKLTLQVYEAPEGNDER